MSNKDQILAPDYLKGHEFTQMLKDVLGCRDYKELSRILDIPKATFSTWNLHDRTSHELMVRLHLATGLPLENLALPKKSSALNKLKNAVPGPKKIDSSAPHSSLVSLKSYLLSDGILNPLQDSFHNVQRLQKFSLNPDTLIEIETNEAVYLIDETISNVVIGTYLTNIDENYSINDIQRLPGKTLAVTFGEKVVDVADGDIGIIGRVVLVTSKA